MLQTTTDVVVNGALDGLAARQRAYVNNVANVDTPGFKPSDVPFEAQLRKVRDEIAGKRQDAEHTTPLDLSPVVEPQNANRADGNDVQIDTQVTRLEENSMTYEALAQAVHNRNSILMSAITEGRK